MFIPGAGSTETISMIDLVGYALGMNGGLGRHLAIGGRIDAAEAGAAFACIAGIGERVARSQSARRDDLEYRRVSRAARSVP